MELQQLPRTGPKWRSGSAESVLAPSSWLSRTWEINEPSWLSEDERTGARKRADSSGEAVGITEGTQSSLLQWHYFPGARPTCAELIVYKQPLDFACLVGFGFDTGSHLVALGWNSPCSPSFLQTQEKHPFPSQLLGAWILGMSLKPGFDSGRFHVETF